MPAGPFPSPAAALLLAGALAAATPAWAQISVPAGDLPGALNALSRAAQVEILADPALLKGKRAPAIQRAATPDAAIRQMLRGTGLSYRKRGRSFLIVRAPPAPERAVARRAAQPLPAARTAVPPSILATPEITPEIIVTGTHIARPDLESAMPVSVVDPGEPARFGRTSAYDALAIHPAMGPGIGLPNTQGEPWDAGAAFINLRNMGTNRSLTLVDGRRRVSGAARSSAVDINLIPHAMIERIEVVTGGAAAIHGADAVTGAVNLIMKKEVRGLHLSATGGISARGDAREHSVSLTSGTSFAEGRGTLVIGGTYTRTAPLGYGERYTGRAAYVANPASRDSSDGVPDNIVDPDYRILYRSRYPVYYHQGQFYILRDGVLSPTGYDRTHTAGEFGTGSGSDGATGFENHFLRAELHSAALSARLRYALTPALSWHAYLDHGRTYSASATVFPEIRTDSRGHWFGGAGGEVATLDNPFLPDSLRAFMQANGLTALKQGRSWFNFPQPLEIHRREHVTAGTGIGGRLGGSLNWSAFFQFGQNLDRVQTVNIAKKDEWLAARDVIADPVSGAPVCRDPAARAAGCVPLDMFSTAPASSALIAYVLGTRHEWRRNRQYLAGGEISGGIASLPYGEIVVALGGEWRRDLLSTRDDPDPANLANLVYLGVDYILHPALDAERTTSELYGEAVIPLLDDLPLAHRLKVEGAYRFSRYTDNPDTHTWKLGLHWSPFAGLTLRGVRSHSVRVPNFGELYAPAIRSQLGIVPDPCNAIYINQGARRRANCAALGITTPLSPTYIDGPLVVTGGNPALTPETSDSFTLGAVIRPRFLPGFDLTADYWNIAIDNVVTQFPYTMIMNLCVDSATIDNVFCRLQARDPATGHVRSIDSFNVNVARMQASGIDVAANYRRRIGPGELRLAFTGTWLIEQTTTTAPGVASGSIAHAGGYDHARFKAALTAGYQAGRVRIGVNGRFISRSLFNVTDPSPETRAPRHVPAYLYTDVMAEVAAGGGVNLTFGVRNVTDADIFGPLRDLSPGPNTTGNNTGAAYYDAIGRYFFGKITIGL